MNNQPELNRNIIAAQLKEKYGLEFEGYVVKGPEKPAHNGETPIFNNEAVSEKILEKHRESLNQMFGKEFSAVEMSKTVLAIANKIVKQLTGQDIKDSAHVFILSKDEFSYVREAASEYMKNTRGITQDYHGLHAVGGLILIEDPQGNAVFPLLFHEIGHSLYPNENDNFKDEFRAMYFQILSTKLFEKELEKLGIHFNYPDDYYADVPLPTEEHREAFKWARVLHKFNEQYDMLVPGNTKMEQKYIELQTLVKQPLRQS